MYPDRLYIQHTRIEDMLTELAEQVTVKSEAVVRVEAIDRAERVGTGNPGNVPIIDHHIGVDVTAADPRGDVHVLFLGERQPLRVLHQDGNATKDRYKEAFADARERRSRLIAWLEDEGWTVRGGRVFVPREVFASGFPGSWASDPMHAVEEVINGGKDGP